MEPNGLTPLAVPLDSPSATLELVGGKGASLARLSQAGLPVPPGFHLTTAAYRKFVEDNALQTAILDAVQPARADDPASLDRAAERIRTLLVGARMPVAVAAEIGRRYDEMGGGAVAVRSSATAEDLPGMSFAGQLETFLNVCDADAVVDAVRLCWASLWTARAIGYRIRQGIAPDSVGIAVVVQKLVAADVAGILFTANPVTGARDEIVINAAWGLGEAVVGGLVTPDTYTVNRKTNALVSQDIAVKETMTVRLASGTREEPVAPEKRNAATLTADQALDLAKTGETIERLYGMPMDIEWALCGGVFFVLQARPITALPEPRLVLDWAVPRANSRCARSSVVELMPEPLTPLFRTLGLPAFNDAMRWLFEAEMGLAGTLPDGFRLVTINDFAYYDFGGTAKDLLRILTKVPGAVPRIYRLMRRAIERWRDEARPKYAELTERWTARDLRAVPNNELLEGARDICRMAGRYYVTIQAGILPIAYSSEAVFTRLYERAAKRPGDPAATAFLLGFDSIPIESEKSLYDLAIWARGQSGVCEHLASTPNAEIAGADDEFGRRLRLHLERYGRSVYDLDFAKTLPAEDPAPLIETLKYFVTGQARNPHDRQAEATAARESATRALLGRLGFLRQPLFAWVLGIAQRFSPLRENALADVGLGWLVLRSMLRELGRRLVEAHCIAGVDDVFWLEPDEAIAAAGDYSNSVADRRAKWERERKATPPVVLPPEKGARMFGMDFSGSLPARMGQACGKTIRGVGSSPGRVTGVARVIHGPDEFSRMKPGDILVAKATTPAWTPLFALAAGIVTDVGGPLSHSSIVAREYRIPAVLGTGVATERIRSGQQVSVDGDAGIVTIR